MNTGAWCVWIPVLLALCAGIPGCQSKNGGLITDGSVPTEALKIRQPAYVIEPPDVLVINAGTLVPAGAYHIGALDVLNIEVTFGPNKLPLVNNEPISGMYAVTTDGKVDLGPSYGSVTVAGLTFEEASKAIEQHLLQRFKGPLNIRVDLAQSNQAVQQVRGEHLVRLDGTIGLGVYGSVAVDGLTIEQAKAVIESHLSRFLVNPKVAVDVAGFNSKVYYVITDGAGAGQQVYRLPLMGKETVLDAIAQINGLTPVSSRDCIWVARPKSVHLTGDCQICENAESTLPVDWDGITQCGRTGTNYQLMPGDRVFVMGAPIVTFDTYLARIISPIERVLGVTLLGSGTVNSFKNNGNGSGF